jgi:transglutaminase-like putative cysteine protease
MRKNLLLSLGLSAILATSLFAQEDVRKFKVHYHFDIKYSDSKEYPAKLWNPMPFNSNYQQVKELSFSGNYDKFNINRENIYNANTFYAKWGKDKKRKTLDIDMIIETKNISVPIDVIKKASAKNLPIPDDVKLYLKATTHIPTDGIIKALANKITAGKNDRFEKVKAIYDWCTAHTFRDKKVVGCGKGDVGKIVTQKEVEDAYKNGYYGGKCTDLSSLFTALVRAAGIPAREVFGIRLGKSYFSKALGKSDDKGFANITTWQHCRAQYYIPGAGWIPADPADITKLELVEGLKYNDPKVQKLKEKYLHSWEMNWVGFNTARDFILYPKPEQYPLNMFGYPYAEVDGDVLNYYNPKEFSYTITSQEIK